MNAIHISKIILGYLCVLGIGVLASVQSVVAQVEPACGGGKVSVNTNSGTEFLLVYMANENDGPQDPDPPPSPTNYQKIYMASLGDTATVTITCKATGYNKSVFLNANEGKSLQLNADPSQSVLVDSKDVADDKVVYVHSTSNIVCYGMSHKLYTADAFLALPKNVAKTGYMVMTYTNSTNSIFQPYLHPAEFAVAAFDDNTTVTITTPEATETVILNAHQCVQVQSDYNARPDSDLTGSIVMSDKPVVVYGGHRRTDVPHNYTYSTSGGPNSSRDHVSEAIPPLTDWGKAFIVRNFPPRNTGDLMRVLSSANNNIVTIDGVQWGAPMKNGEYRDTLIAYSGTAVNNIFAVQTSQPSLVGMFMHTASSQSGLGDPFFAVVPPLDQTYNDYTYFISDDSAYHSNYLVVATEKSGAGVISIDSKTPAPAAAYINAKAPLTVTIGGNTSTKSYAVSVFDQSPGIHRIVSPNPNENGFTILAYGIGIVDSYGYTAGGLFKPQRAFWLDPGPAGLPAPGKPLAPTFTIRNILGNEDVWLDSLRITYSSNPEHISVTTKNMPMTYFGILPVANKKHITLVPATTPTQPITGTATIYYHTGFWTDLEPFMYDFTIEPGTAASVKSNESSVSSVSIYPNPVTGDATTLEFSLAKPSHTTLRIYDALGRMITTVADAEFSVGPQSVRIATRLLTDGSYFYELSAPDAGIAERGIFTVLH